MLRKDLERLVRLIEPQVVGILIAQGYVTSKERKFSDFKLTQKGKAAINMGDSLITNEWIKSWRFLWPASYRSTNGAVRDKLSRFLLEHEDVSLKDIKRATQKWLAENQPPYCGKANYFFYKVQADKTEISRCEEYLELIEEQDQISDQSNITIL